MIPVTMTAVARRSVWRVAQNLPEATAQLALALLCTDLDPLFFADGSVSIRQTPESLRTTIRPGYWLMCQDLAEGGVCVLIVPPEKFKEDYRVLTSLRYARELLNARSQDAHYRRLFSAMQEQNLRLSQVNRDLEERIMGNNEIRRIAACYGISQRKIVARFQEWLNTPDFEKLANEPAEDEGTDGR